MSKIVFVVGAGASNEFGLPIGSELAMQISRHLRFKVDRYGSFESGDYGLYEAIQLAARDEGKGTREYLRACRAIQEALPTAVSIDTFLEVHEGDHEIEFCGKLGIAYSILKAERSSYLRAGGADDHAPPLFTSEAVLKSWISVFVRMVQVGISKRNIERALENVTFVIFNYDRCVEHYLFHWFQLFYRVDAARAAEILSAARFFHPYGVAGKLPWQNYAGSSVPFGAELGSSSLLSVSAGIRTYSEQVADQTTQEAIHASIVNTDRLVFLGFGFGEQNMKFLTLPRQAKIRRVFGTAYNVSKSNQEEFEMRIANSLVNGALDIDLQQVSSAQMLSDHDAVFVK